MLEKLREKKMAPTITYLIAYLALGLLLTLWAMSRDGVFYRGDAAEVIVWLIAAPLGDARLRIDSPVLGAAGISDPRPHPNSATTSTHRMASGPRECRGRGTKEHCYHSHEADRQRPEPRRSPIRLPA